MAIRLVLVWQIGILNRNNSKQPNQNNDAPWGWKDNFLTQMGERLCFDREAYLNFFSEILKRYPFRENMQWQNIFILNLRDSIRLLISGKRTPTSVRRRSSRVDFRLRNPSSPDVVFVMKALFSILDPQNRVETNTCFVFAHDFVLASRYLHFFPLLTYITDSQKFLRCLLFTDGRLQVTTYIYNYNIVTPPRNLSKGGC